MIIDNIVGESVEQGVKQGVKQGVESTLKASMVNSLQAMSKEGLESTFGRQIPRSYLDSTGKSLTKSGAEKFYRTSIRGIIRDGGPEGLENAIKATSKSLGIPTAQAAEMVVGNLGSRLTRQLGSESVQAALKGTGKTIREIICSSPAVIRSFLGSVYRNAIRLGKNPKQALKEAKAVSKSIAFKRATLVLGVPAAAYVLFAGGYAAYNMFSGIPSPTPASEQDATEQAEKSLSDPGAVLGQSIMGITAVAGGGILLLGVLMTGNKKDKAVAASEDEDPIEKINRELTLNNDGPWAATCAPDGEGDCELVIDTLEELLQLEKDNKIEIPEYAHEPFGELLLYDCDCDSGRYNQD